MRLRTRARPKRWVALWLMLSAPVVAGAGPAEDAKLTRASSVIAALTADADAGIPREVLARAQGIAILPDTIRGGFLLGGRRGRGVLAVRTERGDWSAPSFVTLTAGSIGWQIGAESADLVLVFANAESVANIERGKFSLSGDITAVAGPQGAHSSAPVTWKDEVYAYVLGRGLFAGAAFEGARIGIDVAANTRYYSAAQRPLGPAGPALPASARRLLQALQSGGVANAPRGVEPAAEEEEEATIYPLGR